MLDSNKLSLIAKKFITFEGGEGSGKSTQSFMLYRHLKSKNIPVILTREIGGTPEAEKIRNLVIYSEFFPTSELMLAMAARFEHINKVIIPALRNNYFVICDRFVDSTAAYQGQCKNIGIDKVYELHEQFIKLTPHITFFMDINPKMSLKRVKTSSNNKFEEKNLEFHKNVNKLFNEISNKFQNRVIRIDIENLNKKQVHQEILRFINKLYYG